MNEKVHTMSKILLTSRTIWPFDFPLIEARPSETFLTCLFKSEAAAFPVIGFAGCPNFRTGGVLPPAANKAAPIGCLPLAPPPLPLPFLLAGRGDRLSIIHLRATVSVVFIRPPPSRFSNILSLRRTRTCRVASSLSSIIGLNTVQVE